MAENYTDGICPIWLNRCFGEPGEQIGVSTVPWREVSVRIKKGKNYSRMLYFHPHRPIVRDVSKKILGFPLSFFLYTFFPREALQLSSGRLR
mgnify:CR=1 FL=1